MLIDSRGQYVIMNTGGWRVNSIHTASSTLSTTSVLAVLLFFFQVILWTFLVINAIFGKTVFDILSTFKFHNY